MSGVILTSHPHTHLPVSVLLYKGDLAHEMGLAMCMTVNGTFNH